jgi:hypothetical protein
MDYGKEFERYDIQVGNDRYGNSIISTTKDTIGDWVRYSDIESKLKEIEESIVDSWMQIWRIKVYKDKSGNSIVDTWDSDKNVNDFQIVADGLESEGQQSRADVVRYLIERIKKSEKQNQNQSSDKDSCDNCDRPIPWSEKLHFDGLCEDCYRESVI